MRPRIHAALLVIAVALVWSWPQPAASAAAGMTPVEQAIETQAYRISLPASGVGTMAVIPCRDCQPVTLLAVSATRWFLGKRSVGFAELQKALVRNPDAPVVVFYRHRGTDVTRLVLQTAER
jgi:hypothetical protein